MNYFFLSDNPHQCAIEHLDKHVVKMSIEYPQMLSTAHRILDGTMYLGKTANNRNIKRWRHPDTEMESLLYKASHINHPTSKWVRESADNYNNLYDTWIELLREYTYRYGKVHLSGTKLSELLREPPKNIPDVPFTEPPPAMSHYPQCIVEDDIVQSYRNYYKEAKAGFAKWTRRPAPKWFYNV